MAKVAFEFSSQTATVGMEDANGTLTKDQLVAAFKSHERFKVLEVAKK